MILQLQWYYFQRLTMHYDFYFHYFDGYLDLQIKKTKMDDP